MNIELQIQEIWEEKYITDIPSEIKERGWCYSDDVLRIKPRILIIGFNPSFRETDSICPVHFSVQSILKSCKSRRNPNGEWDTYWSPICNMLCDDDIDLRDTTAYWDLFSFREKNQSLFKKHILSSTPSEFVIKHIQLAQRIIEECHPELIIVKNKEAWGFFGYFYENGNHTNLCDIRWMNYRYEDSGTIHCGDAGYELKKIIGIHDGYDLQSIDGTSTELTGTRVLFMPHINHYTKKENRPTVQTLCEIIDRTRKQ